MTTTTPATTRGTRPSHNSPFPDSTTLTGIGGLVGGITSMFARIPDAPLQLFARLAIAPVFWLSGQTKVDGWTIKDTTFFLFRHEYQLPLLPPELAAYLATAMEHALPVLLVIGLATRFAALGLLGMTLVIQLFVYPEVWSLDALWAAVLVVIVARGPGAWSLDHWIACRTGSRGYAH